MKSKIYKGKIEHTRYLPVAHRFNYPLYVYAIDLDELPELDRRFPLFGYNRLQFASIFDRDYLLREKGTIFEKLYRCLESEGIGSRPDKVTLITSPRYLNYVFNPVNFYYCYTQQDTLLCIITEVNNTYGERHLYVLKDTLAENNADVIKYKAPKAFHVSPFNRIEGEYEFTFSEPRETLDISIRLNRENKKVFDARLTGVAFLPLWIVVSKKIGKKAAWLISMGINTGAFIGVLFLGAGDEIAYGIIVVFSGIGFGAGLALPSAIQADVIDYDELISGLRREGLFIGIWSIAKKLAAALGVGISLYLLGYVGYEPNIEQSGAVVLSLKLLYGLVPCLCNIIALMVALLYPISQEKHREIRKLIEERGPGSPVKDPLKDRI